MSHIVTCCLVVFKKSIPNMNKRIICLIDTLSSGGAERQMVGLAVLLKNKGYDVDLLTYRSDNFYIEESRKGGIEPIILKTKNNPISKLYSVRKYIKKTGCDWMITYKGGPCVIGCLLKIIDGKFKLIVSERTSNKNRKLSKGDRIRYYLYRYANYVVPNSYTEADYIKDNYLWLKKKTITITNFTDTELFKPKKRSRANNEFRVLTAARVTKTKNIVNYIEAIKRLKESGFDKIHFDWYGRIEHGHEEYANTCQDMIRNYGLSDFIEFHPATSNILSEYQSCDLFCLPSIYEGYPNVICEAMSCGIPIVCSRVCDNPKIVSEGENGELFAPDSIEELTEKLKKIIKMPFDERKRWGERSRDIAIKVFSAEAFVRKYIQLIER